MRENPLSGSDLNATQHSQLTVVADRGYFSGWEILACEAGGITPYVPKPLTSRAKSVGRFGKQDFVYLPKEDAYHCPAGERLDWRFNNEEGGKVLRNYWTTQCHGCALTAECTTGKERRIKRWEHEGVLDAMQSAGLQHEAVIAIIGAGPLMEAIRA